MRKKKIIEKEKLLKEREKQKRARNFGEIGKLAYKANIDLADRKILLGAFLDISTKLESDQDRKRWEKLATEFTSNDKTALAISFKTNPSAEIKEKLKDLKFQWNKFRKEFYGYGRADDMKSLLDVYQATVIEI